MKNIYVTLNKISFIILFITFSYLASGQCPTAPSTCNFTVTSSSGQTSNFTIGAGQALCIQSGTYTGTISSVSSSGTIYVYPGATFNPSGFNNFGGRLVNCGTMNIPSFNFDNPDNLARIENYNVANFIGAYGFNRGSTWINGLTSKMTFENSLTMNNVHFTNNGNVLMKSSFTMNTGTNTFINHDSLTALGTINLNAAINNDGYLFAKGSEMIMNATGNITNGCYFKADGGFTYNGNDTLLVTGFTWVTGKNGNKFVLQGKAMKITGQGFAQGIDFENNSTPVLGNGNFRFTGTTKNQNTFGSDGLGLNFYDASLAGTNVFDQQNTLPHPSVTKNPIPIRDSTFVPNTCSNLIKCNTNTGDAGPDTTVCGSTAKLRTANPNDPQYQRWGVVAGNPSPATIDPVTGQITGMNIAGDYYFNLYKFTNSSCSDIIKVTVTNEPTPSLTVVGNAVCRTATNTTVTVNAAQAGVLYEAYRGTTLLGSATGTGANLPITIPLSGLVDGVNTITFKAKRTSCATVDLTNAATVTVSPDQNIGASVTANSPICSGSTTTVTIAATNGITYTLRDQNNTLLGSATATSTGNLNITTSALTATTGPQTYTITVTASVANCANKELTAKPVVTVNPSQNAAASVTATSPLCSGATSTVVIAATNGITYTVRDQGNNIVGSATATTTGNLNIVTSALTATGSQATYTLTVTATVSGCTPVELSTKPQVVVNPLLAPSVTLASSATTVCAGTSVTVTATPTNGGTSPLYQWRVNGANVGAATSSNTFTSTTLANGDVVSVIMTSNAICATPTTANSSNNITMTVNPLLAPSVSLSSSATTICAGTSVTVTATPTNGGASPIYQWRVNGSNVGAPSTTNTFTSTTLANNDVVSVQMTSNATCATPSVVTSASNVTMTVNPNVTPLVSISSPATSICAGSSITFTATPTHGGAAPGYQWRVNGVNVNGETGSSFTTNSLVNGDEVTVLLTSNATCRTSNTALSNMIKMTIGTNLVPSVNISTPATTICAGSSATFTATVANAGTSPSYQWKINNINAGSATSSSTFTRSNLVNGDQVSVTLTSNETCVVTNTANSNVVTMTVNPVQPAGASVTAISPICSGGTSTVTINATAGMTYTVRDQNSNVLGTGTAPANGNFNISTSVLTAAAGPTSYTLTVTASIAGCTDVTLTQRPVVVVNPAQNPSATVSATSPICSGGTSSIVSVFGTNGITYSVRDQNNNLLGSGTATANGNIDITTTPLLATTGPTTYTFTITASVAGCANVELTTKPTVIVNPSQDPAASVTATSPICSGGTSVVTIAATNGITYTLKDQNNNTLGSRTATANGSMTITTGALTATTGPTSYTITVTASVSGCNDVVLTQKPVVVVNPSQNPAASVTATSPICSGGTSTVTVFATNGITYTVRDQNNNTLGSRTATANGNMTITTSTLTASTGPTTYTFTVTASVAGCSNVVLTQTPVVTVNPAQNLAASVTATSPICSGGTSVVTIAATNGMTYTVRDQNNNLLGTGTASANGDLNITTSPLTATDNPTLYTFSVTASVAGCNNVVLTQKPTVEVNRISAQVTALGSVICSTTDSATVTLSGLEKNVTYRAYLGSTQIGTAALGTINQIRIPNTAPLVLGNNVIEIRASINGCNTQVMNDTARVVVNLLPSSRTFTATSPICEGTFTAVALANPQTGVRYTVTDSFNATTSDLAPSLNALGTANYALVGVGLHTLGVKADIAGCATVTFPTTANVQVNTGVRPVIVTGIPSGPICQTANSATLTIVNPEPTVDYNIFKQEGTSEVQINTSPITEANPSYTIVNIPVDTNYYIIKATIGGCGTATVYSFEIIVSDSLKTQTPQLDAGPTDVCEGGGNVTSVVLSNAQKGVAYRLFDNGSPIGNTLTAISDGQSLDFGTFTFLLGPHVLTVKAKNAGCDTVQLLAKDSVNVNKKIDITSPALRADTNVVCSDGTALLRLSATQVGVTYVLLQNGVIKDSAKSNADGQELQFGPYSLVVGTHTFTLRAHNNACSDSLLTAQAVKVNDKPNADLFEVVLNGNVLCSNAGLIVQVRNSRSTDYSYWVVDEFAGKDTVLGVVKLGNNGLLEFGPFLNMKVGDHKIKIVESVQNCASDTSAAKDLKINNSIDTSTPEVTASSAVICENGQVSISITKTSMGDIYRIKDNGNAVLDSLVSKFDGDTLVFGPIFNLDTGDHIFTATTKNAGCGLFELDDTAKVRVSPIPDENTTVRNNSPICLGNEAVITVNPVRDVTYTLYRGTSLLSGPSTSILRTTPTKSGKDTLFVVASVRGCSDVRIRPDVIMTINQVPSTALSSDTVSTCLNLDTSIPLFGTDSGWRYIAKVVGKDTNIYRNGGGDISFALEARLISQGFNKVVFFIDGTGTGCPTTPVADTGAVYGIGNPDGLQGTTIVCETYTYDYHIPLQSGIVGYTFEVLPKDSSTFTVLSSDSIRVTWGKNLQSGAVVAHPITTTGVCDAFADTLGISIFVPYDKKADFKMKDTLVCAGYVDTVSIQNLRGGTPVWVIDRSILVDSIVNPPQYTQYVVRYNSPGTVQLKYYIVSPCTGMDSIMQQVVVLPNPVASAGNYPVLTMKDYPREIVLDGSASSKTPQGAFRYKWSTIPPNNVSNSTSLMASFVPEQTFTKAVLTVSNANGMCPVSDTALIAVDLGIFIPNVFTPNGDGDHDIWVLENVNAFYPDVKVDIYSKWGTLVYHSEGYNTPWDGTRNNQELPSATYYYVIDLKKPNFKPIAGSVTIIR